MSLDRREFIARLGAGAAAAALVTTAAVVVGVSPAGAVDPQSSTSAAPPDPYREWVVNGSFEDGPEAFPVIGWQGLV